MFFCFDVFPKVKSFARNYTNSVRDKVKRYTNSKINEAKAEVKNYANFKIIAAKGAIKSERDSAIVAAKNDVKGYINSENQKLESKIDTSKDEVKSFARDYTNGVRDKVKSYTDISIAAAKAEIKSDTVNAIVAAKAEVKSYAKTEVEKLESKIHEIEIHETLFGHSFSSHGLITLEGSDAGPDRGYVYYNGRPLCDDNSAGYSVWDIQDAHVICRMLGFARAANSFRQTCNFGDCPPEGIPFAMSGFKCTGSETHITDCPHDATVPSYCGNNGVTHGDAADIVGVECE